VGLGRDAPVLLRGRGGLTLATRWVTFPGVIRAVARTGMMVRCLMYVRAYITSRDSCTQIRSRELRFLRKTYFLRLRDLRTFPYCKRLMGRKLIYGARIHASVTVGDLRALKAWAKSDRMTVHELIAELIGRERLRRSGIVGIVIQDREQYDRVLEEARRGR
jgi:hypothetical protein